MSRDHSAAKKFRDVVASIARAEFEKSFPGDRYALVHEIREADRRVIVQYNGEAEDNLVSVPYNSVRPAYVGQWVRIGGGSGDRHVIDTLGQDGTEAWAEEAVEQQPLPPRWERPSMKSIETMDRSELSLASSIRLDITSNAIAGTVVRIPSRMSISGARIRIDSGRSSGHVRMLLYRMTPTFDAELVAESEPASGSSGVSSLDFTSLADFERGENIWAALHNQTGGTIGVRGCTHHLAYFPDPGDAVSYRIASQATVPPVVLNSQFTDQYLNQSWWFTLNVAQ